MGFNDIASQKVNAQAGTMGNNMNIIGSVGTLFAGSIASGMGEINMEAGLAAGNLKQAEQGKALQGIGNNMMASQFGHAGNFINGIIGARMKADSRIQDLKDMANQAKVKETAEITLERRLKEREASSALRKSENEEKLNKQKEIAQIKTKAAKSTERIKAKSKLAIAEKRNEAQAAAGESRIVAQSIAGQNRLAVEKEKTKRKQTPQMRIRR